MDEPLAAATKGALLRFPDAGVESDVEVISSTPRSVVRRSAAMRQRREDFVRR
jgi:hypothetical protein